VDEKTGSLDALFNEYDAIRSRYEKLTKDYEDVSASHVARARIVETNVARRCAVCLDTNHSFLLVIGVKATVQQRT